MHISPRAARWGALVIGLILAFTLVYNLMDFAFGRVPETSATYWRLGLWYAPICGGISLATGLAARSRWAWAPVTGPGLVLLLYFWYMTPTRTELFLILIGCVGLSALAGAEIGWRLAVQDRSGRNRLGR